MGRGRQKAKNTKIARDLKYAIPDTNFGALQRELSAKTTTTGVADNWVEPNYDEYADKYGDFDDEDDD
ncbi:MAG: DUF3073 domain-containing protein [Microbacteriaceae bacterium]